MQIIPPTLSSMVLLLTCSVEGMLEMGTNKCGLFIWWCFTTGLNFRKVVEVWPFKLCDVCVLFAATGTARPHVDYLCSPRKHGSKSSGGSVIVAAKTPSTQDYLVAPHGG